MRKRKLEELNLMDDFLFFKMLNNKVVGEEFGRYLLEIIFDRKFGKLKVVPQRVYYGQDTELHGIRIDVYMEEEIDSETLLKEAAIYDIEPEGEERNSKKTSLPRRARFYHSTIDVNNLESGADYSSLKKVIVVIIMPFDPFGYDHMVYTIQNTCLEVPELPYDDGAKTMFLYTRGKKGNPTKRLQELLCYMENTTVQYVKNEELRAIHNLVNVVKRDPEVSRAYMKSFEIKKALIEEGRAEGLAEGLHNTIRKMLSKGMKSEEIADLLDIEMSEIECVVKEEI